MAKKEDQDTAWEGEEGVPDDFDFAIVSSKFGYLENYNNAETALLIWEGDSPDEDANRIIWPCGKGWKVVDRGKRVEHTRRRGFVTQSIVGKMITRVVQELGVDMKSRGEPLEASVWEGLSFHLKKETLDWGKDSGIAEESGGVTTHLMPTAVVGKKGKAAPKKSKKDEDEDEEETPKVKKSKVKDEDVEDEEEEAPKAKKKAKDEDEDEDDELAVIKIKSQLKKLAKEHDDREEFQKAAMDVPGVSENDDISSQVLDDSDDGFYARHHE